MYRFVYLIFLLPVFLLIVELAGIVTTEFRFDNYRTELKKAGLTCVAMQDITLSDTIKEIFTFGGDGHSYIVGAWKPTPYNYGKYGSGETCEESDVPEQFKGYEIGML